MEIVGKADLSKAAVLAAVVAAETSAAAVAVRVDEGDLLDQDLQEDAADHLAGTSEVDNAADLHSLAAIAADALIVPMNAKQRCLHLPRRRSS